MDLLDKIRKVQFTDPAAATASVIFELYFNFKVHIALSLGVASASSCHFVVFCLIHENGTGLLPGFRRLAVTFTEQLFFI